jgi:hypothetical protein
MGVDYTQQAGVKRMMEAYDDYLQAVAEYKTNFSDEQAAKLAIMLNTTKQRMDVDTKHINESVQVSDVGNFKKQALALISAVMPNLIAEELVGVQPLQLKVGQIFFLKYMYGSTRNGVKAGDMLFDRHAAGANFSPNYTHEDVTGEEIAIGDAAAKVFEGNIAYIPLRPGTVAIKCGAVVGMDNGNGVITGSGITGTIDYNNGAFKVTFTNAPGDGELIEADYAQDLEYAPAEIPEVQLKIEETTVRARPRKLKTLYAFDAGYDLKQTHGIDIDQALLEAAVAEIKTEIDAEILRDLYNQAGGVSTWNKKYDPTQMNISQRDHYLTFIDELISAGNQMFQETRRVQPNWIVVGKWGADILDSIGAPRFVNAGPINAIGPHFAGTLDGRIKVYKNPYYREDQYLLGYKGTTLVDAGFIYAPYLPIYSTQLLMMEDFVGRRGFATSSGKKMVNNKLYVKGVITNA